MILKIPKTDLDAIKYVCAESDFLITEYTIESNDQLVQVEITGLNGEEVLPQYAFRIGTMYHIRRTIETMNL